MGIFIESLSLNKKVDFTCPTFNFVLNENVKIFIPTFNFCQSTDESIGISRNDYTVHIKFIELVK